MSGTMPQIADAVVQVALRRFLQQALPEHEKLRQQKQDAFACSSVRRKASTGGG
jgi:hypothetical protein